jgi:hypothetical protein
VNQGCKVRSNPSRGGGGGRGLALDMCARVFLIQNFPVGIRIRILGSVNFSAVDPDDDLDPDSASVRILKVNDEMRQAE